MLLSNFNGETWPKEFNASLEEQPQGAASLVSSSCDAANNSFGGWKEYKQMIGMGWCAKGFGERLKLDDDGKEVLVPAGRISIRAIAIAASSPSPSATRATRSRRACRPSGCTTSDELYEKMRGPIENVKVLAMEDVERQMRHRRPRADDSGQYVWGGGRVFRHADGRRRRRCRCVGFAVTGLRVLGSPGRPPAR